MEKLTDGAYWVHLEPSSKIEPSERPRLVRIVTIQENVMVENGPQWNTLEFYRRYYPNAVWERLPKFLAPKHPTTSVAVFLSRNGLWLAGERYKDGCTLHCIPGGKIDWLESPETAVLRELKEETGLTNVGQLKFVGYTSDVVADQHFVTLYFQAYAHGHKQPVTTEPSKQGEWAWYERRLIPELFVGNEIIPQLTDYKWNTHH